MNAHVHYRLTRRWAVEAGFSEAEAEEIAQADVGVDRAHGGGLWQLHNWGYHYRLFGANVLARRGLRRAIATGSLQELGVALHRVQDAVAHGWPGLLTHALNPQCDLWDHRSQADRDLIENRTREMLQRMAEAMGRSPVDSG